MALPNPAWPAVGVEVDFQSGPPTAAPTAARMSINAPYRGCAVRALATSRGRQQELDTVQAGTCALDVPDPNEYLNPDNAASPFNTGLNDVTPYRSMWWWAMWPTAPGAGNINNPTVDPSFDPDFEATTGVGGWVRAGGTTTIVRTTAAAFSGTHAIIVTQSGTGASSGAVIEFPTVPGITYTVSAYVQPTAAATVRMRVVDAGGTTTTSGAATTVGAWTRISVTWVAVDTLEQITVYSTATTAHYIDAVQLEFGSTATAFQTTGPRLYPQFSGFVERWPTHYDSAGFRAVRPLVAVDALAILSRAQVSFSYDAEITVDKPLVYLPLDNAIAPATGVQLGAGISSAAVPHFTISANGAIDWGRDMQPDGAAGVAFTAQNPNNPPTLFPANSFTEMVVKGGQISLNPGTGFTWSCWTKLTSGTGQFGTLELLNLTDPPGLNVNVPLVGAMNFNDTVALAYNPDGTHFNFIGLPASAYFPDGDWHYLYFVVQGTTMRTGWDNTGLSGPVTITQVGNIGFNTFYAEASSQYAVAQAQAAQARFAVYGSVLTSARLQAHYQRGVGYRGELPGARAARLLAAFWGGPTTVAAGLLPLAADFAYAAGSVLAALQDITASEQGRVYATTAGAIAVEDRSTRYATQTAIAVLGENTGAGELPYTDIEFDHDPTYVYSQVNLSRPDNNTFPEMVNAAAEAKYGQRILTRTVQATNDFDLTQAGIYFLGRYGTPKTRLATLQLVPSENPALWPICLGLEISQRVTVKRRSAGLSTSADYYVEKVDQRVDPAAGKWVLDLELSPVFVPSAWVLGDGTRGVLGSTTTPIY